MKAIDENFFGRRGSIPPQLFKYIDTTNMAAETARFTEYMNEVAALRTLLDKIVLNHPNVILHMYRQMSECLNYRVILPHLQKFIRIVTAYKSRIAMQQITASKSEMVR